MKNTDLHVVSQLPEPWVDIRAVVEHIGFSDKTVRKMVREGKLPGKPIRNGTRTFWRFQLSAVDAAMRTSSTAFPHSLTRQFPAR